VRRHEIQVLKVVKRFSATLVATCLGLLLLFVGLESVEDRGVVPSIPDWLVAITFLPTLVTESTHGGFALFVSLCLGQFVLLGSLLDWFRGGSH
jgi:hypothetical protein